MALPKIGTVILRKHHRTKAYELFFIFLGSRKGTCFLLNRHGNVVDLTDTFLEYMFKTRECKIVEED
jgi:hypothetical protein